MLKAVRLEWRLDYVREMEIELQVKVVISSRGVARIEVRTAEAKVTRSLDSWLATEAQEDWAFHLQRESRDGMRSGWEGAAVAKEQVAVEPSSIRLWM